jgi:hypothetical protein
MMSDLEIIEVLKTRKIAAKGNAAEEHLIDELLAKMSDYILVKQLYSMLYKVSEQAVENIETALTRF